MIQLNRLGLLCVVMALFVAGCGKKKQETKPSSKQVASADKIPTVGDAPENLLDNDLTEFAFVDDEAAEGKDKKAGNLTANLEESDLEVDDQAVSSDHDSSFKTVHFDFNKNSIREDQKTIVAQDVEAAKLAVDQGKKVVVEGHTCQIGSASYNLALSQRRAETVKAEMIQAGVPVENIKTVGRGYENPVVWSDQTDRATLIKELSPNRRSEILTN
jgi:outer membrane protein OmpA-like peptidoglycan-associated protein